MFFILSFSGYTSIYNIIHTLGWNVDKGMTLITVFSVPADGELDDDDDDDDDGAVRCLKQ